MSSSQSRGCPRFAFTRVKNPDAFNILRTFPCGLYQDLIQMSPRTPTWNFHYDKQSSVHEILNQKQKILLTVFVMSLRASRNATNSYNNMSNCNSWRNCYLDWVKEWANLKSVSYMDVSWKRTFLRSLKNGFTHLCVRRNIDISMQQCKDHKILLFEVLRRWQQKLKFSWMWRRQFMQVNTVSEKTGFLHLQCRLLKTEVAAFSEALVSLCNYTT